MGLWDCVASPEERDTFEENERPVSRPRQLSRSDHDISRRRNLPLFSSQASLKNIRDEDFWRNRVLKFIFYAEGREDIRILKVPLAKLGYSSITEFISGIPAELYNEYQNQAPSDEGIYKEYKVFWIRDGIAEPGAFKWQGMIENQPCVGVQLDRKKAVPFGIHDGKGLFYCKPGHRALVPEHEVTPYKEFLRSFLGVPLRKDSFVGRGSIRYSAKAIAAKNAKPGDRVYLPKEKKWANVLWIGRIDNETVVDLIFEPPKPEAGKIASPDVPCMSRSLSMADFIDEVRASEPNTPVTVQPQYTPEPLPPTLQKPPTPKQVVPPPPPPPPPIVSDESDQDQSDDLTESSEEDDDSEEEETGSEPESEHSNSDESVHSSPEILPREESHDMRQTNEPELISSPYEPRSPKLVSPKRKGFFGFSSNKKIPKSPVSPKREVIVAPVPPEEYDESDEPQQPPLKTSKSSNIFSNFRFPKSGNKQKAQKAVKSDVPLEREKIQEKSQKKKSDWGRLFKSKSKGTLERLQLEDSRSPLECSTPIDEMMPPDKIPTPPPSASIERYSERRIEGPDFNDSPPSSPSPPAPGKIDNKIKDVISSPATSPTSAKSMEFSNEERAYVHQGPLGNSTSESDSSEWDEEHDEVPAQEIATKVEMQVEPEQHEEARGLEDAKESNSSIEKLTDTGSAEAVNVPEIGEPPTRYFLQKDQSQHPALSLNEQFKQSKVRNRPTSYGSFLKRIKNQPRKPDGSLPTPQPPTLKTFMSPERDVSPDVTAKAVSPKVESSQNYEEPNPRGVGYKTLSESSLSSSDRKPTKVEAVNATGAIGIYKSVVKPPKIGIRKMSEGNQEEISLELLDVKELQVSSPQPVVMEDTPKRKNSKNKSSFTFSFSKKRKPSHPQTPTTPTAQGSEEFKTSEEDLNNSNVENIEPPNEEHLPVKLRENKDKEAKQSLGSSFRNSFRRTFSLTRKKPTISDSDGESPMSPSSTITRPRPITLYIDNNEVVEKKNSFRKKRPTSLVVDLQPWNSRHGTEETDIYSDNTPTSPTSKSPNSALLPKQTEVEIPKHRIFTTPAFLIKKNKKPDQESLIPKASEKTSLFKKWNTLETESQPLTPHSVESTPVSDKPPPLPTAPPPGAPGVVLLRGRQSFSQSESSPSPESPTKLKSALKQRKKIDSIPRGLQINDRVLWYSTTGPIPGTVQRLYKDGTDKYTAMVKFDREIGDEPLRLIREGDAYIVTVEELITPDMFTPIYANQQEIQIHAPIPQTPVTPSVRFDEIAVAKEQPPTLVVEDDIDDTDHHDLPPPFQEEEVSMACGFRRGIQCRDKSCCLETILFSLFYTTNTFDISMLYPNTYEEDALSRNARRILRREIVDPLRRQGLCGWPAVKKLRDAVKPLSDEWQTLSTDAEVMMFILFDRALKLGKFISYSNDMADFLHQLVVDAKDLSKSTTVQHLFENSLQIMDKLKLRTVPTPALILEMPRSKDKLLQYKAVIPNPTLHISHLLDNGPRLCICGVVANYECKSCTASFGTNSIVFCENCKASADIIHFQLTHQAELINLSQLTVILDLVAIICIKAGHYFSFVKCGNDKFSPWVFFDGEDSENPKVCIEQNLGMWLDRLEKYPGKYQDALQYPLLTHILQDSHICVYQPREKSSSV